MFHMNAANAACVIPMIGLLLGGVVVLPADALAEGTGPVPGSRVRVTLTPEDGAATIAHGRTLEGRLVGFDGSVLSLRTETGGKTFTLSRERFSRLEVSRGAHGQSSEWAAGGFVVGALAGLAMGAAVGSDEFIDASGELALAGGVAFGLIGALLGAGLGAAHKVEHWEPVSLEPQAIRREAARPGTGARVALRMRF